MKASLQLQPMYCSRDHNYSSRFSKNVTNFLKIMWNEKLVVGGSSEGRHSDGGGVWDSSMFYHHHHDTPCKGGVVVGGGGGVEVKHEKTVHTVSQTWLAVE